ncbi:MAG: recombination protein RecR [bacterium]|nr:recombination protein RecR [bacterium]
MHGYTRLLDQLINELTKLPGIGRKSGQRLAFYLLKADENYVKSLTDIIEQVKDQVHYCAECGNLTEDEKCNICSDVSREHSLICVVEDPSDVRAIERSGAFGGVYHVLMGVISPLDGIGPEDLNLRELLDRAKEADEVIVATGPDVEGDTTALYIAKLLGPLGVKVTRIASGLPVGTDLQYADEVTLGKAITGRQNIE